MHRLDHFESGGGSWDMSVSFGGKGQKGSGEDVKRTNTLHHSKPQHVSAKTTNSRISNLPRPLPPLPEGQKGTRGGIERGPKKKRTISGSRMLWGFSVSVCLQVALVSCDSTSVR